MGGGTGTAFCGSKQQQQQQQQQQKQQSVAAATAPTQYVDNSATSTTCRILAAGNSSIPGYGYDWALLSAGPPTVLGTQGLCRTPEVLHTPHDLKAGGLWIMTRLPVDPSNTLEAIEAATELGFDVQQLKPVTHRGCQYAGLDPLAPVPESALDPTPLPSSAAKAPSTLITDNLPDAVSAVPLAAPAPAPAAGATPVLESGVAPADDPPFDADKGSNEAVTQEIFFDLEQGGKDLGRVTIGLCVCGEVEGGG